MRTLFIILLLGTLFGCKEEKKQEVDSIQNMSAAEKYYYLQKMKDLDREEYERQQKVNQEINSVSAPTVGAQEDFSNTYQQNYQLPITE